MTHRDLDALVAQARGWTKVDEGEFWKGWGTPPNTNYKEQYPNVSTDIAEAMALVEELRRGGNGKAACCIRLEITDYPVEQDCRCTIYGPDQAEVSADGHELPEAICLAYLKARGVYL